MASEPGTGTIDPREAAHFGAQAADWWDPNGGSAMLHKLGPVRLRYIREAIDRHWGGDPDALKPLAGKRALDIGCGAGLVAEPLCRLGATMTAIDAAPENIDAACHHAVRMGLPIDYRSCDVQGLHDDPFDLITCLEVLEHVTDPVLFIAQIARLLRPDGLLILSTPNRTPLSQLVIIRLAEGFGRIPKGTHDWSKFLTPQEVTQMLEAHALIVSEPTGISADPRYGFVLGQDLSMNYILTAAFK